MPPIPMTTLAAGNSSDNRARQAAASWRASIGAAVTTTTSDSRAETIASGARVATKCSMLSQMRCRWAAASWAGGRSNAIATTLWSRAGS